MGYEQTSVKIVVDVQNRDAIDLLKKQVTDLEKATRSGGIDLTSYVEKIRDAFKASNDSSEALKAQIALWEKVRGNVSSTTPVYAEVSAELVTLRKNLEQVSNAYTHVSESAYKASTTVTGNTSAAARSYMGLGPVGPNAAEAEAAAASRSKLMENVGLGVGFPLLFGGGAGSMAGGALGSFVGEGFAGQIVGSALGAKFDEAAKSVADFARSLREGGDAAGYLKQTLGYLDPKIADEISNLQQAGLTAQAAKVAFEEMGKAIGEDNAQALKDAGNSWDTLGRNIALAMEKAEAAVVKFFQTSNNPIAMGGRNLSWVVGGITQFAGGAPAVKEDSTTQAYRDRLAASKDQLQVSLAQEEAAKTILKDNIGLYTTTQKEVAEAQKIVEYNKVIRDLAAGRLSIQEKIVAVQKIESDYSKRINEITRQAQDEQRRQAEEQERKSEAAAQKAKEEEDKRQRLIKDQNQILAQSYDAGTQYLQVAQEVAAWGKTDLDAAKDKYKLLDKIEIREQQSFELRRNAAEAEAAIKGTLLQTNLLMDNQQATLKENAQLKRQQLALQIAELEATEKTQSIQRQNQLLSGIAQGNATNVGLQAGIARSVGLPTSQYDRSRLAYEQQARYLQQVAGPQAELDVLRNKMRELELQGKNVDKLREEVRTRQSAISSTKEQLGLMFDLETQQERLNEFTQKYGGFFDAISQGMTSTFDLLVTGTDNWGNSLRRIASTVLQDIAKQLLKIYVIDQSISFLKSAISGINPGGGGGGGGLSSLNSLDFFKYAGPSVNANGNVFAANGIVPYAMGGIVDKPMLFPFAKGIGLMGEAGPEAIMPLKRGADGKLGVAGGGGSTTINVSVDAKGSSVQGDGGRSNQLARVIAAAVQDEMIKQKRPGGLLAA
jgi:hypothetical protein